jgi:hypothetical protein
VRYFSRGIGSGGDARAEKLKRRETAVRAKRLNIVWNIL